MKHRLHGRTEEICSRSPKLTNSKEADRLKSWIRYSSSFAGVHGEVLDVDCGTGAVTFALAKNKSVSKIGVDLSEGFLV
jgi:ubiquinone/menaquinone biosynthesis C-methylase UbiE